VAGEVAEGSAEEEVLPKIALTRFLPWPATLPNNSLTGRCLRSLREQGVVSRGK
jgi:hypothetical protein